jgi:exopolysaccharide biosynthesis predicted pyruvyltransferase EpsI
VSRGELIAALMRKIETSLEPLIPRGKPVALLDFPWHMNSGDSAIWLGELAFLRRNRNRVVYLCDPWSYSPREAERRMGNAMILIHGGGNFGDIYLENQALRERAAADFPDRRIVQFPQTLWFSSNEASERAGGVFRRHPDFTLMVRDSRSREFAEDVLGMSAVLCPDMAFALGPLDRSSAPAKEVVWLGRTDLESTGPAIPMDPQVEVRDWLDYERPDVTPRIALRSALQRAAGSTRTSLANYRGRFREALPQGMLLHKLHARGRLAHGCDLLSRGRVVVTDRLHGHILSVLLGIPNVLIDNSYGKNQSFYATWTHDLDLVRWAKPGDDPLQLARSLVPGLAVGGEAVPTRASGGGLGSESSA